MSQDYQVFRPKEVTVADQAARVARTGFIQKTYVHLLVAVLAFAGLEAVLLSLPVSQAAAVWMLTGLGGYAWLLVLGMFLGVSWIADRWAHSATSLGVQYLGLGVYVVAEAIIFLPLLYMAAFYGGAGVIPAAGIITGCVFVGLTGSAFISGKNFGFLRPFLAIGGMAALGLIAASILIGFSLGILFSAVMILFAAAAILYQTSNVIHEYREDQYVAASLGLFASVALLFWYVLNLLMSLRD
jgi:FtsH-binding integral membrane protein